MFDPKLLSCVVGSVESVHPRTFVYYSKDDIATAGYFPAAADFRVGDKIICIDITESVNGIDRTEKAYVMDFVGGQWTLTPLAANAGGTAKDILSAAGQHITATNVQDALNQLDKFVGDQENDASIFETMEELSTTINARTVISLDDLLPMDIDSRPSHKEAGALVVSEAGVLGIITAIEGGNADITTIFVGNANGGGFDSIILPRIQDAIIADINLIQYITNGNQIRIKAGSEFLFPNGAGVYNRVEAQQDIVMTVWPDHEQMLFTDATAEHIYYIDETNCFCGPTAPTAYQFMLWYDTANNQVKYTGNGGTTWQTGYCMPFAIGDQTGIKQCFCTGMGYMANCMWVLDGMAVSIPHGKKPDSTYNNDKYVLENTIVHVFDNTASGQVALTDEGNLIFSNSFTVNDENYTHNAQGIVVMACRLADYVVEAGRVKLSNMRTPMRLITAETIDIPTPPASGTFVLTSTNGVLSWEPKE